MNKNQALIAKAREVEPFVRKTLDTTVADLVRDLADTLEAATIVETGWEYGTAHREDPKVGAVEWSKARAEERVREWNETTQSATGFVVRRRAAGPWLSVEGEAE